MNIQEKLFMEETPENLGISSQDIINLLNDFEENGFYTHSFMIMRHGKVAAEGYYAPFKKDELHRIYSISKTFTATAIGFLIDEGKISLDDQVHKFFPEKCPENMHRYLKEATVRDLLTMSTPIDEADTFAKEDWIKPYFNARATHPSGTIFRYDTPGTQVLCTIVEKVTGKPYLEYLKDKALRELGFSENAWCIKATDGHSWGGSGVQCTLRDLATLGLLYLNGGKLLGKQYLSEGFAREATKKQVDSNTLGHHQNYLFGYGYKIWITRGGTFTFNGMGDQMVICLPEKDFMFVCFSDNQGNDTSKIMTHELLWKNVIEKLSDTPLPENKEAYMRLKEKTENLTLYMPKGELHTKQEKEIDAVSYVMDENNTGISKIKLSFSDDCGTLYYDTPRGEKEINFGLGKYVLGEFPETHYHGETIGAPAGRGFRYAATGCWTEEKKFVIKINIIDICFGNLNFTFSFKGDDISVFSFKVAERFLDEYTYCFFGGKKEE